MHQDYETGNHAMFSPFNYVINSNFCESSQKPAGWLKLQDTILFISRKLKTVVLDMTIQRAKMNISTGFIHYEKF